MRTRLDSLDLVVLSGPEWLFVALYSDAFDGPACTALAGRLQPLLERNLSCQLILDLNQSPRLSGELIGQMAILQQWIEGRRGRMRVCGLSAPVSAMFRFARLDHLFCVFADVQSAVHGGCPVRRHRGDGHLRPACKAPGHPCRMARARIESAPKLPRASADPPRREPDCPSVEFTPREKRTSR